MIISAILRLISKIFLFTGRLSNKNFFAKPLSEKEETECFIAMNNGDKLAEEKLVKHNLRLVAHIVKKYVNTKADQDDLISVGSIGLMKAVKSYNPQKGNTFSTYASRCIQNEILMLLRSQKKLYHEVSLEDGIKTDKDGNEVSLIDIVEDTKQNIAENTEIKILYEKMLKIIKSNLCERDQKILFMRFGLEGYKQKTQNEVAKHLGISRSYISRLEKKSIKDIKSQLKAYL